MTCDIYVIYLTIIASFNCTFCYEDIFLRRIPKIFDNALFKDVTEVGTLIFIIIDVKI